MDSLSGPDSAVAGMRTDHGLRGEQKSSHLESGLWDRLPECLIEEILGKLPFSSLLRYCSISKRWRDLILSSRVFPRCTSRHGRLVIFDYVTKIMRVFTTSSLELWETVPLNLEVSVGGVVSPLCIQSVIISAGGLLCFRTCTEREYIVYNPLTKWRKVLQMPRQNKNSRSLLEGMVVDCNAGHFKLIVLGVFGTTLVYDSCADSWNQSGVIQESVLEYLCNRSKYFKPTQPIAYRGSVYFYLPGADRLLKYDVGEQAWSWILLPKHVDNWYVHTSRNIIQHNGKLLSVIPTFELHRVNNKETTCCMNIQVFELQSDSGSPLWLPTKPLPLPRIQEKISSIVEEFPIGTSIDCLGDGDIIFFIRKNLLSDKSWVKKWCHNAATNSYTISNWGDYQGDGHRYPHFQMFLPSTTFSK